MKKNNTILRTLSALMLLLTSTLAWGWDFEAKNADSIRIYYNLINNGTEAEVTSYYVPQMRSSYSAKVMNIPETVVYNGKTLNVTRIGYYAFVDCSNLTSVTIPETVKNIGNHAFSSSGLTSVTIPNSVTTMGENVFSNCENLTSVTLPNNMKQIPSRIFSGCSSLLSIDIPDGVTSIGYCAFSGCTSLTSISIPESVTIIDGNAFQSCSSLTSITIPEGVTMIAECTFASSGLTSIIIPNNVTKIGQSAFEGCTALTSITLGKSVAEIGYWNFGKCINLTEVRCLNPIPPRTDGYAFHDNYKEDLSKITLYVPLGSKDAYASKREWTEMTIVEEGVPDEALLAIGEAHYATFMAPFDVEIPENVTAYTVEGIDGDILQLSEMKESIPANTPVILYCKETISKTVSGIRMTTGTAYTEGLLTGVYTERQAPVGSYVLQNHEGEVAFYYVEEEAQPTVAANRAYLTVPESANGVKVLHFGNDDATGIETVESRSTEKAVIYDMTGRRAEKAVKGMYIIDGKKVMVK